MTRRARQGLLIFTATLFGSVLTLFLTNRGIAEVLSPPTDFRGRAEWIREHPADWLVISAISEEALDAQVPQRHELWRSSFALARRLAPRRRDPTVAFVRGGLFQWYELSERDRAVVLREAAPLLREPQIFSDLHDPLWQLTRNFGYLRRNAPDTLDALEQLRGIAVSNGLFADYREMRDTLQRKRHEQFEATRPAAAPSALLAMLPRRITKSEEPLVRSVLQELHRRSFAPGFGDPLAALVDYAIRHRLRPMEGLAPFVETPNVLPHATRARLALALGRPEAATAIELGSVTTSPEWIPYFLERAMFEARRGDAPAADVYLRHASSSGIDARVLATAEMVATTLRNSSAAAHFRSQLVAQSKQLPEWKNTCGTNEVCDSASTTVYVHGDSIAIDAEVVQSDQTAPYVEIYVDDARAAEGSVDGQRRFVIPAAKGVHRIEVRLVNARMANGAQRRVRLSRSTTETAAPRIAARVAGFEGMKKLKSKSAWTMAMVKLASAAA